MVAYSCDRNPFSFWYFTDRWIIFCPGTLYLFFILAMKISREQQSIIAITAGFLLLAWLKHSYVFLIAGGLVAFTFPFRAFHVPIHRSWMFLSDVLGWISSHIILSILFFLLLTPISMMRKLLGKQDMKIFAKNDRTVFYERNHVYQSKDFENPW